MKDIRQDSIQNGSRNDDFKHSGIEWLGQIPKHWEVRKLKYLAKLYSGDSIKDSEKEKYSIMQDSIPYIATKDIDRDTCKVNYENGMWIKNNDSNFKRAFKDNILLCLEGSSVGKKIAFLDRECCFVNKLCCIASHKSCNNKVLFYVCQGNYFQNMFLKEIYGLIGGVTIDRISELKIPLPPLDEQRQIADYLDSKCKKIDDFITKKNELIKILNEKKQSLINEAVCGRVDCKDCHDSAFAESRNDDFKHSGIEWLGQIPKHWEVRKLKYLVNFDRGLNITRENLQEQGILCVNYGEIHSKNGFVVDENQLKCVDENYLNTNYDSLLFDGDFVFADTSGDVEGSGNFMLMNLDTYIFAGYHTIICRVKSHHCERSEAISSDFMDCQDSVNAESCNNKIRIDSKFLAYEFESRLFRSQIQSFVSGVKVYSITQSILKEVSIVLPPLDEQK